MSSRVFRSSVFSLVVAVLIGGIALAQTPPPAPPTGLYGQAGIQMPYGVFTVRWAASAGATSYNVYAATSTAAATGQYTKVGSTTALQFSKNNMPRAGSYVVYVTAVGPGGESQRSALLTLKVPAQAGGG